MPIKSVIQKKINLFFFFFAIFIYLFDCIFTFTTIVIKFNETEPSELTKFVRLKIGTWVSIL